MSLRSFQWVTWTPTATADAATTLANSTYMGLMGGSTTQVLRIEEIYMGGQAGASTPSFMLLSRDSTVQATPTALAAGQTDAALDPAVAALAAPPVAFVAATTPPQRSTTLHLLNLSFNAFGGIVRWAATPNEIGLRILGNTASFGEMSLSAFTGGTPGLMGSHIVYEPM
jgi:hypothetical protein